MIDNEATQTLPGNNGENNKAQSADVNNGTPKTAKKTGTSKTAYAAGGFVAGVAATASVNAMAAGGNGEIKPEEVAAEEVLQEETPAAETINVPSEQDAIIATDEGIRVAQVDDDKTFAEAFADARQQVGPGGVFEWHGKVYSTYQKDEWDQMSANERAEWQAKVDYDDVRDPEAAQMYAHNGNSQPASQNNGSIHPEQEPEIQSVSYEEPSMASDQEMVDDTPVDGEIKILGIDTVTDDAGNQMTVAGIDANGDQVLLVDIDNDGNFDALLHDDNSDGQISSDEIYDASGMDASVADIEQAYAEQNGMLYAANDDMPDYSNDADTSSFA